MFDLLESRGDRDPIDFLSDYIQNCKDEALRIQAASIVASDPMPVWKASTICTGTMGAFDTYMRETCTRFDKFRAELDYLC